jgi:subtilisin family serine protease
MARWRAPKHRGDPTSVSTRASGTSFATPAVTGAVALMLSHDPALTQIDVRTILRDTTSPWAPFVRQKAFVEREIDEKNFGGKGLINIEGALKRVKARLGP